MNSNHKQELEAKYEIHERSKKQGHKCTCTRTTEINTSMHVLVWLLLKQYILYIKIKHVSFKRNNISDNVNRQSAQFEMP